LTLPEIATRYVDFATRNWPTWWQHRFDVPVLGGGALIILSLLIIPIFWLTDVTSEKIFERADKLAPTILESRQAAAAIVGESCDRECSKKQRKTIEANNDTLRKSGVSYGFVPLSASGVPYSPQLPLPLDAVRQQTALSLVKSKCDLTVLSSIVPALVLAIGWLYLVSCSLYLVEAPGTKNQPYSTLLLIGTILLMCGPFFASRMCWFTLAHTQLLTRVKLEQESMESISLFLLTSAALSVSFIKLIRAVGFTEAITATAVLIGIVIGCMTIAQFATYAFYSVVATAAYLLSIAAIVIWHARIPKKFCTSAQAIAFYYSAFVGPMLAAGWLVELKLVTSEAAWGLGGSLCLLVASAVLMEISSFVSDRLSHEPR
jgi:hypothetical protein